MILYHGTTQNNVDSFTASGISLEKGREGLDFGKGFYASKEKKVASKTAKRKAEHYNSKQGVVPTSPVIILIDYSASEDICRKLYFEKANIEWSKFVRSQRDRKFEHDYDVVIGPIADGKIALLQSNPSISDEEYLAYIRPRGVLYGCTQYLFHTIKALEYVSIIDYE